MLTTKLIRGVLAAGCSPWLAILLRKRSLILRAACIDDNKCHCWAIEDVCPAREAEPAGEPDKSCFRVSHNHRDGKCKGEDTRQDKGKEGEYSGIQVYPHELHADRVDVVSMGLSPPAELAEAPAGYPNSRGPPEGSRHFLKKPPRSTRDPRGGEKNPRCDLSVTRRNGGAGSEDKGHSRANIVSRTVA